MGRCQAARPAAQRRTGGALSPVPHDSTIPHNTRRRHYSQRTTTPLLTALDGAITHSARRRAPDGAVISLGNLGDAGLGHAHHHPGCRMKEVRAEVARMTLRNAHWHVRRRTAMRLVPRSAHSARAFKTSRVDWRPSLKLRAQCGTRTAPRHTAPLCA